MPLRSPFLTDFLTSYTLDDVLYMGPRFPIYRIFADPLTIDVITPTVPRWTPIDPRKSPISLKTMRRIRMRLQRRGATPGSRRLRQAERRIRVDIAADFSLFRRAMGAPLFRAAARFTHYSFAIARACQEIPQLTDIALSRPWLAMLMVADQKTDTWAEVIARVSQEVRLRQRHILSLHGFPNIKGATGRIPASACDPAQIDGLRQTLSSEPILNRFRHERVFNTGVLGLYADSRLLELVMPSFLSELSTSADHEHAILHLRTYRSVMDSARIPPRRWGKVGSLTEFCERYFALLDNRAIRLASTTFPPTSPLPDTDVVRRIADGRELLKVALTFENCVFSRERIRSIVCGKRFMHVCYGGLGLEPVVFEVARDKDGRFVITEIEGKPSHRAPDVRTVAMISRWARTFQVFMKPKPNDDQMTLFQIDDDLPF
jgi:hypothetical protein